MVSKVRKILGLLCLALLLAMTLNGLPASAQGEGPIYVVPLRGEIDSALPLSMEYGFDEAADNDAQLIILEIDTFGGLVDASDKIKNIIYDSPVPVYAYVKKAISGGAYVALACDQIYMQQGSTLGAVEPVAAGLPVTDEKTLSVIEGQMRTMAERQERDPMIASAMVRKEIGIPGVIEPGRLLTLTASQAKDVGYAEGIVNSISEIPALAGISDPEFVEYTESWAVRFSRYLSNPFVGAVLLAIGLAALVIEIFAAGFGVAGVISLIAFGLYFGGNLIIGVAEWEYIAVFIVGIVLLIAEAFAAGFGVLGAAGLGCIAFSIVLSASTLTEGLLTLGLAILLAIIIVSVAFRFLRKSKMWNRLILNDSESIERGYVGPKDMTSLLGAEGTAITPLRPSGTVSLSNGQRVDAITDGSYIAVETKVIVTGFSSGSVIVSPNKN